MRINRLEVENLRFFEHAGFDFQKGMNLLVGENGSGKTIILDALRFSLSGILPLITANRCRSLPVVQEDIRAGADYMSINCSFELRGNEFSYSIRNNRAKSLARDTRKADGQLQEAPDKDYFQQTLPGPLKELKKGGEQPFGVYFSTGRSSVSDAAPSKRVSAGGQASAFADALSNRELRIQEIALWMKRLEEQCAESPLGLKHLSALRQTAESFFPQYRNLRAEISAKPRLVLDKEGETVELRQLSSGERSIYAMVLDLAQRLSRANPGLADPVKDGSAIVLIDELELHLHPRRQRTIVRELTENFPNCQFIATTHSPQLISSVRPEHLFLLKGGEVARPPRTLGMDSNWILGSLMGADERSFEATAAIEEVETMMKEWELEAARERIAQRRREGFDLPYWSILEARMARMEDLFEREP